MKRFINFFTKERQFNFFGEIGKYSAWEFEGGKFEHWSWFEFIVRWTRKCDHPGPEIYIEILGYWLNFYIYDGRHWNYDKDRFYLPGEEMEEINKK